MITKDVFCELLRMSARDKVDQGHDLELKDFEQAVDNARGSYDALAALADRLDGLSIRADWPYVEPNDWEGIRTEMAPGARDGYWEEPDLDAAAARVRAGFTASVCGCVLGKPVEVDPTLAELKAALEQTGDWPLRDYVPRSALDAIGRRNNSADDTTRGNIRYVAPDDDINYTIMGMVLLEKYGVALTREDIRHEWVHNIPPLFSWGPERIQIIKSAINSLPGGVKDVPPEWTNTLNPGSELCGALIRADAYGYACPGNPMLASRLAFVDAGFTHHRTGIYATQYIAAVIALTFLMSGAEQGNDRLLPFEQALDYIPRRSRFHHIASDSLRRIRKSTDWMAGYESVHLTYRQYTHCMVYQEIGTLMNSLKYAEDVGDGFCKQVSQGNDTDSFGATSGSILGVFFGPGHLEDRWTAPFNNRIHTTLACFHEQDLEQLIERMGRLPAHVKQLVDGQQT